MEGVPLVVGGPRGVAHLGTWHTDRQAEVPGQTQHNTTTKPHARPVLCKARRHSGNGVSMQHQCLQCRAEPPFNTRPVCLNLQAASATAPAAVACVCPLQLLATSNPQEDHPWRLHRSATQLLRHSISTAQHSTRTTTAQHKGPYLVAGEVVGAAPGRSAPGPCPPCGGHGHRGGHGQGAPALGGSWVGLSARRCARAGTSHQACSHPFLHTPTQTSQTVSAC